MLFNTTGFSRVVFQLQPTSGRRDSRIPPASGVWCFNFALRTDTAYLDTTGFMQPRGVSTSTYEPSLTDGALEERSLNAG
jgi:hypothetical protein